MYVLCNSFVDAKKLFYQLEFYYAMPWNWMIRGLVKMGCFDFALSFYFKMLGCGVLPDKYTFPPVIKCCTCLNNVRSGKVIQDMILEMGFNLDMYVASSLIKLYADNGCIEDARRFFDKMIDKDCVSWNVMINGYVQCGESDSAIKLFKYMMRSEAKPDSVTFACVLSISCSEAMVQYGRQLHGLVVRSGLDFDPLVGNTLVTMYSKGRQLGDARKFFDMMPQTDLVVWNRMIGGYVQNGFMDDASMLFNGMVSAGVKPDSITFTSFLSSLAESSSLRRAKEIHGYIVRHGVILDIYLKNALIVLYFKCRDVVMACRIFNLSTQFDIVIYTAMISGYVLNGMNNDALEIFRWLLQKKMIPNALTYTSILPACAGLAAIKLGRELHGYIIKNELEEKCPVGSAIMNFYAKCGRLDLAHLIFGRISKKDAIYGSHPEFPQICSLLKSLLLEQWSDETATIIKDNCGSSILFVSSDFDPSELPYSGLAASSWDTFLLISRNGCYETRCR
ncbi:hypothetical protein OIU84_003359 [Salix udensis]|uniref:Pentatricopeptide repeat-containing protein n=1 Tax=Salix udensis TaxID=889485 RepID=A0AAD6P5P6_9ROSI|nr:hypothetical protein OIU84_003359 [Salix udensis]